MGYSVTIHSSIRIAAFAAGFYTLLSLRIAFLHVVVSSLSEQAGFRGFLADRIRYQQKNHIDQRIEQPDGG